MAVRLNACVCVCVCRACVGVCSNIWSKLPKCVPSYVMMDTQRVERDVSLDIWRPWRNVGL